VDHLKYFIGSVDFSTFMSGKIDFVLSLGFFSCISNIVLFMFLSVLLMAVISAHVSLDVLLCVSTYFNVCVCLLLF